MLAVRSIFQYPVSLGRSSKETEGFAYWTSLFDLHNTMLKPFDPLSAFCRADYIRCGTPSWAH